MSSDKLTARLASLLALYDLGGSQHAVDTEDIAIRAVQVAPKAFRWKRYPEQVNLERVRMSLVHNKEHKPTLISGGVRDGWQLTPNGIKECKEFRNEPDARDELEIRRIKSSAAFSNWQKQGENNVTRADLMDALRINEYFPESKRRERVVALVNRVRGDSDLECFVEVLRRKYPEVMRT